MNSITYIKNKPNTKYLSDTMDDLPENCVFNKITTGCGASHIALTNMKPTILAVPFRVLVQDKVEDTLYNVLAMSCDYKLDFIPKYQMKIICTYQSLEKLSTMIDISKYNLVIDESHLLLQTASYSPKDIVWMMNNYKNFKSYTFMSATLHERDLWLPEIRDLPMVEMKWDNIVPVKFTPLAIKDTSLQDGLINIILDHLDGTKEGNPFFFYNSLKGIVNLVKRMKKQGLITNEDYRIVCAPKESNRSYLKSNLSKDISKPSDKSCKLNFITSTAFEGVNFYDKQGVTYIVSDKNNDYAKYDIVTTVPQIIGRIRDSIYNDNITIIYDSHSLKVSRTLKELDAHCEHRLKEAYKGIRDFNTTDAEDTKKGLLLLSLLSIYYYTDPGIRLDEDNSFNVDTDFANTDLFVNKYAPLIELAFFKLINSTWHINVIKDKEGNKTYSPNEEHFTLKYCLEKETKDLEGLSKKNKTKIGKKISFKDLCEMYESGQEDLVQASDPTVCEYYKVLGKDKIQAYSYHSAKIKQLYELETQPEDKDTWITKYFTVGKTYKKSFIIEQLKDKGATKTLASHLKKYFECKQTTQMGESAFKIIRKL